MDFQELDTLGASAPASGDAYEETLRSMAELSRLPAYRQLHAAFREGAGKIELRKRYMLKMIDEAWVSAIEDTIPSLDVIMRNPSMLLQEKEKVVAIEQTRRVTSRSIQHLVQHTDLINEIREDGSVMPSKLLNVFQDETILSYENKFINTLLTRVYGFVSRRYDAASACGEDEKTTCLDFEQTFTRQEQTAKVHLTIQLSEKPRENEVVKNYIYTSDLWNRVQRVYHILTKYMDSDFVRRMNRAYIRPPVMRTNKLLKNVDFHQCLLLWEFLDQYDNTGYETLIQENLESVDEACIRDIYHTVSMQYVVFQKHIHNDFAAENTLDSQMTDKPLRPKMREELEPLDEKDFEHRVTAADDIPRSEAQERILRALSVAMTADSIYQAEALPPVTDTVNGIEYDFSFLARLILAQNPAQYYYSELKNALLSYENISCAMDWHWEDYTLGQQSAARMLLRGQTVFLYLPLEATRYAGSVYAVSEGCTLQYLLKVHDETGLRYAMEMISLSMAALGTVPLADFIPADYRLPFASAEELAQRQPPLAAVLFRPLPEPSLEESTPVAEMPAAEEPVTVEGPPVPTEEEYAPADALPAAPEGEEVEERNPYSFTARLILGQEPVQTYYEKIKNYLLSFEGMECQMCWGYEVFRLKGEVVAEVGESRKALTLSLPMDPTPFVESKYRVKARPWRKLPTFFKVRTTPGVTYAKELIDMILAPMNPRQGKIPRENYHLPYQSPKQMMALVPPLVLPPEQQEVGP